MCVRVCVLAMNTSITQKHKHSNCGTWYYVISYLSMILKKKFLSFRFLFFPFFRHHAIFIIIIFIPFISSFLFFLLVMVSFFSNFFHWLLNNKIQELCVFVSVCVCMHVQCNNNHNNSLVEYNIMKKKQNSKI